MKSKVMISALLVLVVGVNVSTATDVKVTMNTVSKTMSLKSKATGRKVEVGEPTGSDYRFNTPDGDYVLTAYASDGTTVNGTIDITVNPANTEFKVLTCTAYVNNKTDNQAWTQENGDYILDVNVNSREGNARNISMGNSTTAGRYTYLALNGDSYAASFVPSEMHQAEGYMTLYRQATLTFNATVSGLIPMSAEYTVKCPADAEFTIGMKFSHFIDFTEVQPLSVSQEGNVKAYGYRLALGQVYNYRTWKEGGLTQAGYFTMSSDAANRPEIGFSDADYEAYDPDHINHSAQANNGFETGDILVNVNERNYMNMSVGDVFKAHAMRSWELTDNSINNYLMEPDFHYTVLDENGGPSTGVIEIESKPGSAWADIKAVGNGTAIVLVTYDAIGLNYYTSSGQKTPYMGGEYWGAIWPENTAAYVITVGQSESTVKPEMIINAGYNDGNKKMAGKYVDAEHDIFYYLDSEQGFRYTFKPENAASVSIAYPVIGERMATYTGFGSDGVMLNADGSYSLLLKEGRQIVRLTDSSGNSTYQILTAKVCHREISNLSRSGSNVFIPGDKVKIQYSGLFHPANKMAGIYNMSAYVTYNSIPNGTSLILGSNQYTFGSSDNAQAVEFTIPEDLDMENVTSFDMTNGVIQVNGYGDPIGNHRYISPIAGRSSNFTAIAHKTYFGAIPDIKIPVSKSMGDEPTCISGISDDTVRIKAYYNLQGIASEEPWNGLNIILFKDGTTRKVYYKK